VSAAHIGFRVMATHPVWTRDEEAENFETRQGAIDYAQLMDSKGWRFIRCVHVTSRVKQYETDSAEEFVDVEWQCHFIGAAT
jgi:hypothetical protein